jgi:bisphosphoglycerate-dependent phosphoglycerate mutase
MPWGEAVDLAKALVKDPSSLLGQAVGGYDFAWTREWAATVDLYDVFCQAHFEKPKPYPRPWREQRENEQHYGNTEGRSRAEVVAYLNQLGHKISG